MSRENLTNGIFFLGGNKMTINDRIFDTMKSKKITQGDLANALHITQSSITNWKTRGTTPPMEYLPTICEVLGVSWEYLITGTENVNHFTSEEVYLVKQFRKVLPEGQKNILNYIEFELFKQ